MNTDSLTLGQIKEINSMFSHTAETNQPAASLNRMIGEKVIIRTYSAGNWYGMLDQKTGNEVILKDARRMWRWWAAESISLSAVALHGIKYDKSKIVAPVAMVWLEAIEIIPCTDIAIKSLEGAPNATAG